MRAIAIPVQYFQGLQGHTLRPVLSALFTHHNKQFTALQWKFIKPKHNALSGRSVAKAINYNSKCNEI